MPLRKLRVYDAYNKIKLFTEYSLCQKHDDCHENGFPKAYGGGCYYERLVVRRKRSKKLRRPKGTDETNQRGDSNQDKEEEESDVLEEKHVDDDDGLDLMADKERLKVLLVKVCKMEQDFKFTSASNRCLSDGDCGHKFYCHDITFKCTFIGSYGDRCGASVIQNTEIHSITKKVVQQRKSATDTKLDEEKGEIATAANASKSLDDPCQKGLACHPELYRCLPPTHMVQRDTSGKILCRKYADCPSSHYCSLELLSNSNSKTSNSRPTVSVLDWGLCLPKLSEGQSCYDHRQCRFGHGCVEEFGTFQTSRCHRRCYTNLDCYPKGVCLSGNSTAAKAHLPNMRFCFGERPVLYPDALSHSDSESGPASRETLVILVVAVVAALLFILTSFLTVFYYRKAKHAK